MGHDKQDRKSFLSKILYDRTANTIAISAAALVPLLAMVGGGVDASRYYMAQTRLQAACDAGALAARRAMTNDTFTETHRNIALSFFDQNFSEGQFGFQNRTRNFVGTQDGVVNGTASGRLPTSLMGIFGYSDFNLSVTCSAEINISNTDVMFVLDVTGSMNCPENQLNPCPGGGNNNETEVANSLIVGLRAAVMNFFDTVEAATAPAAQVRYGAVPYAAEVNVGFELIADNPQWMAEDAVLQSRWPQFRQDPDEWVLLESRQTGIRNVRNESYLNFQRSQVFGLTSAACNALRPADFGWEVTSDLGTHQGIQSETINGDIRTRTYRDDDEDLRRGVGRVTYRNSDGRCRYGWDIYTARGDIDFETTERLDRGEIVFNQWIYDQIDTANPPGAGNPAGSPPGWEAVDLTTLYAANNTARTINLPIGPSGAMAPVAWTGCIEEADTVAAANFNPVPAGAFDLDINLRPANNAQRWKPSLPTATWQRRAPNGNGGTSWVLRPVGSQEFSNQLQPFGRCPPRAFRLRDINRAELQNFVNSLVARGSTYHDVGMLWGARFISPRGIFRAANETAPNGDAIARHIIFMTDGLPAPNTGNISAYGIEWWHRRVTDNGDRNQALARHEARFQAACAAARNENITVWVVAFGTPLTDALRNCANAGRAFQANNAAELTNRFREIAQRIAALRLTQ